MKGVDAREDGTRMRGKRNGSGSGSGSGGGRIDDADAAHKVAKALLSRT